MTKAGFVSVEPMVDCKLSTPFLVSTCSQQCGGGVKATRQRIVTPASGNGRACPAGAEDLVTEPCNLTPCPLAQGL